MRLVRMRAGQAGNPDLPFHLAVIRFQLLIGDRPVGQRRAGNVTVHSVLLKIQRVETPVIGGEMHAAAADALGVEHVRIVGMEVRLLIGAVAEGLWRDPIGLHQLIGEPVGQLIVMKVALLHVRAAFHDDDAVSGLRQLAGQDPAGGAGTDDDEIHFLAGLV